MFYCSVTLRSDSLSRSLDKELDWFLRNFPECLVFYQLVYFGLTQQVAWFPLVNTLEVMIPLTVYLMPLIFDKSFCSEYIYTSITRISSSWKSLFFFKVISVRVSRSLTRQNVLVHLQLTKSVFFFCRALNMNPWKQYFQLNFFPTAPILF